MLPVARLTEVFRQAAESRIVVNAHRINQGQMPEPPKQARRATSTSSRSPNLRRASPSSSRSSKSASRAGSGLIRRKDVQVLCPMKRGVLGARNLNVELQRVLNPNPPATVERFGWRFSPGDRVMETQNDYDREVFNGDLGTVVRIDDEEGALIAIVRWPGGVLSVRRTRHAGARLRDDDPQDRKARSIPPSSSPW